MASGEALAPHLVKRFYERLTGELHNLYGPTEAAVDVTWWPCIPDPELVPIGRPIANTALYVLDAGANVTPIGSPGELVIGGENVGRGYHNRPELTAERFVPNRFAGTGMMYRTGDLARWLPDGTLEFLGRLDNQAKLRGFRIEPEEIESLLVEDPGVREAAVAIRGEPGRERLIAYVVPSSNHSPSDARIRGFLAERLPAYMVPDQVILLEALPVTVNGKLDRKALPAPARTSSSTIGPRTATEATITRIWRRAPRARADRDHRQFL